MNEKIERYIKERLQDIECVKTLYVVDLICEELIGYIACAYDFDLITAYEWKVFYEQISEYRKIICEEIIKS